MRNLAFRGAVLASLLVAACGPVREVAPPEAEIRFLPVGFSELPGWTVDGTANALGALGKSCSRILKSKTTRWMTDWTVGGTTADWAPACRSLPADRSDHLIARRYFETWFQPYRIVSGGKTQGLFTGYFEPNLRGSTTRSDRYHVPLYERPKDLVLATLGDWREKLRGERIAGRIINGRLKPYHSRAAIEDGALVKKAKPLVWVDDPIDVFFLHIQGSGRVALAEGGVLRVGYDGHNGHVYHAIGRDLIKSGAIAKQDISLQSIRAWLKAHPEQQREAMNRNPSYIFFRAIKGEGPIGAQGVPLTPGRSLAVDPRMLPLGAPAWLVADYRDEAGRPLRRLMVAQDTGGAIRGPIRGDVFWGHGEKAAALAGPMKASGALYLLLPKSLKVARRK